MNEPDYRNAIVDSLAPLSEKLAAELSVRLQRPPADPEAVFVEFICHPFNLARDAGSIYGWEIDESFCASPFGGLHQNVLLQDVILLRSELNPTADELMNIEGLTIALDEIGKWVSHAWRKIGGNKYHVPAYFREQDGAVAFGLNHQRWVSIPFDPETGNVDKEKLRALG
jgi:hypothetical protein